MLKKGALFIITLLAINSYVSAFDIVSRFHVLKIGASSIYNVSENKSTNAYDIDLFRVYFYDRNSSFGLDLIGASATFLNHSNNYNYSSFFNVDFYYSPINICNNLFLNLYLTGGPSGIKYTVNSDKYKENDQWFDDVLFNLSLGVRLRLLDFDKRAQPNFDLFCEYNFLKKEFKVSINASIFSIIFFNIYDI